MRTQNLLITQILFFILCFDVHAQTGSNINLKDLQIGQRIRVSGKYRADGIFLGHNVELKNAQEDAVIEGIIKTLDTKLAIIKVMGTRVVINGHTQLFNNRSHSVQLKELLPGNWVRIQGKHIEKELLLASTIQLIDPPDTGKESLESEIQKLSTEKWEACLILDIPVVFNNQTIFNDFRPFINGVKRDDDDQQPSPITIGDYFLMGGKVEVEIEPQDNLNLNNASADRVNSQISFKTEFSLTPLPGVEIYTKLKVKRKQLIKTGQEEGSTRFQASEFYLNLYTLFQTSLSLQIGRQRFKDKHEWFIDENLNAIRLILDTRRFDLKFSVADGQILSQKAPMDAINQFHYYFTSRVKMARRTYLGAFLFGRLHHKDYVGLNWFGVWSRGHLFKNKISYWSNIATLWGNSGFDSIYGIAYDIKITSRLPLDLPVLVTVGYAYGSGDPNPRDRSDLNFRQTGFQDNSARIAGLKRVKYYGFIFDPELSNMKIWTLGLGLQPTLKSSLEFLFHTYSQVVAQKFLRDSNISARPLGTNKHLGTELDIILTMREIPNVDLSLIFGYFHPGMAFGEVNSGVMMGKMKFQVFY